MNKSARSVIENNIIPIEHTHTHTYKHYFIVILSNLKLINIFVLIKKFKKKNIFLMDYITQKRSTPSLSILFLNNNKKYIKNRIYNLKSKNKLELKLKYFFPFK